MSVFTLLGVIILKLWQNIAGLLFIFRRKVPEKPEDSFRRFWPKGTTLRYWSTFVGTPIITIIFLGCILAASGASKTPRSI